VEGVKEKTGTDSDDEFLKALDAVFSSADLVMNAVLHKTHILIPHRLGVNSEEIVVDANLVKLFTLKHNEKLNLDVVSVEPTEVKVDRVLAEKDVSGNYTSLVFMNRGEVVDYISIPPLWIDDVALIIGNKDLMRTISEKIPDISVHLEDPIVISQASDRQALISLGRDALIGLNYIETPSTNTPVIVRMPVNGRVVKGCWIYRLPQFKDVLGYHILIPESSVVLELNIRGKPALLPLVRVMSKQAFTSELKTLEDSPSLSEELIKELSQGVRKYSEVILYLTGVATVLLKTYLQF